MVTHLPLITACTDHVLTRHVRLDPLNPRILTAHALLPDSCLSPERSLKV
jgi:hypothetical protein